jgi:hypothetical protein
MNQIGDDDDSVDDKNDNKNNNNRYISDKKNFNINDYYGEEYVPEYAKIKSEKKKF